MTKSKTKYLALLMAAICLIAAISTSAYAAQSIEEQMAANSAAWWISSMTRCIGTDSSTSIPGHLPLERP